MWASGSTDQVISVVDIGDPVTQCLVHGILQRAVAGRDRLYLGAEKLHTEHVRGLTRNVRRAHVNHARQAEARRNGRRGNAVLAGTGLRDDAGLSHALGKQDLAEAIVDLV